MVGTRFDGKRWFSVTALLLAGAFLLTPARAWAWCIYNEQDEKIHVNIPDYNWEVNISSSDGSKCCNWKNCAKADKAGELVDVWITTDEFLCIVEMRVDSYTLVKKEDRSGMGVPRQNIYCQSWDDFDPDELRMESPYGAYKNNRYVRFLATADCQYWHNNADYEAIADGVMAKIKDKILGDSSIRGLVVAGDLTQSSRRDEWDKYIDSISGYSRFVFDGLGNHDVEYPDNSDEEAACFFGLGSCKDPDRIMDDIKSRTRSINMAEKPGKHYSWDWHDVHFAQLNIFPADSTAPDKPTKDPYGALSWVKDDLSTHVGSTGRPVVLIHHYGFDDFSTGRTGETWWTDDQREDYWEAIADYNVIAILTGHVHLDAGTDPYVEWSRPTGLTSGPDFIPTYVTGAARGSNDSTGKGAYLDITIDGDLLTVNQKNSSGSTKSTHTFDFSPPDCDLQLGSSVACDVDTVALDGSGSSDPAGGSLSWSWSTDCANGSIDFPTSQTPDLVFTGTPPCSSTCKVTLVVTNDRERSSTCSKTLDFTDSGKPDFDNRPGNTTISCEDDDGLLPVVTASDACDPSPVVTVTDDSITSGSCTDAYTRNHAWEAKDACGNSRTHSRKVTVTDNKRPTIPGVPKDGSVSCEAVPSAPTLTAQDNCDPNVSVVFDETRTNGSCRDDYTLTRTWSSTDRCGNPVSRSQELSIFDSKAPRYIGIPSDTDAACHAVPPAPPVTSKDNCDPNVSPSFDETRTDGNCRDNYTLTRTWSSTDRCGNASSDGYLVNVSDTRAPALAGVPNDWTASCDNVPGPASPTASDNCDPGVTVDYDQVRVDGNCRDNYTLERTWSSTDRCGNLFSDGHDVVVSDTKAPVLTGVPGPVSVTCESVPAPARVTSLDNCDPTADVDYEQVRTDGRCEDTYLLTRTWSSTDRCSNSHAESQKVDVFDRTSPVLANLPPDIRVECDSVPAPAAVTVSDNCDDTVQVVFEERRVDGDCAFDYTLLRTWTAMDRCGNGTSHTQTIRVVDTTPAQVIVDPANEACIWPPNHKYAGFGSIRDMVQVVDNCDPAPAVATVTCRSNQCDDAPCLEHPLQHGDGSTVNDCAYDWDLDLLSARSEVAKPARQGRTYEVWYTGVDTCGNEGPEMMGFQVDVPANGGRAKTCLEP